MPHWVSLLLLLPAGVFAGVVNTIAGGGSFVTLPLLMLYGLPAQVANGSNRVAILMQTAFASQLYDRHTRLDRRALALLLAPLLPGALLGAYLASTISPESFRGAVGALFLLFTALLVLNRKRLLRTPAAKARAPVAGTVVFFLVGVYGGFLQAGVGVLLLLTMSAFLGRDLAGSNGLKQAVVAAWTLPVVVWFAYEGQVSWVPGLILGVGNLLGAWIGAKMAIAKGNRLIFGVLIAVMTATGLHLLASSLL